MAKPSIELIEALRNTATHLKNGAYYAWGHHGACNCGNLVQTIAKLSKEDIVTYAHSGIGEWTEIAREYCTTTHLPLALIMQQLEAIGLTPSDIHHVEYLSDKAVLHQLPDGFRWLKRNKKEDAIAYFEAFANMLEDQLLQSMDIPVQSLFKDTVKVNLKEKQTPVEHLFA